MTDLFNTLLKKFSSEGWDVASGGDVLKANKEVITSKWFLGSRRVKLAVNCRFDEGAKVLTYRETATEVSVGLPPPTLTVTTYSQSGMNVNESRSDTSPGGGGKMKYGEARHWAESACADTGWTFKLTI